MDADLKRIEEELERLSPESLSEGLISRMEAAMEGWQDSPSGEGKVVPFPQQEEDVAKGTSHRSFWAAAAAVAILGAVAGLLITGKSPEQVAGTGATPAEGMTMVDFSPHVAKRKILNTTDAGIFIPNGAQPVRLMRYDYVDRVEFRNSDGLEMHVERPAVNYILIPVPTD